MATDRKTIDYIESSPLSEDTYLLGLNMTEAGTVPAKGQVSDLVGILDGSFVETDDVGQPGGVASLGSDGKVPSSQLPSTTSRYDYEVSIGDGRRAYTITHNLDVEFPQVRVTGTVDVTFTFTNIDRNNLQIEFSKAINNNSVTVHIQGLDYLGVDWMPKSEMVVILETEGEE